MKSFFEKLTGASNIDEEEISSVAEEINDRTDQPHYKEDSDVGMINNSSWIEEEAEMGELSIDMYQTPEAVIIKTMVAGVKPDDLDISITRDMVTIRGEREERTLISEDDYFAKELYWGSFERSITLPAEVDIEEADAKEEHGLLVIKLPKIDKGKQAKLKVKSNAKH